MPVQTARGFARHFKAAGPAWYVNSTLYPGDWMCWHVPRSSQLATAKMSSRAVMLECQAELPQI